MIKFNFFKHLYSSLSKHNGFFRNIKVGETLKLGFQGGSNKGIYHSHTAKKANDEIFKKQFMKDVSRVVRISPGNAFGFLEDVFIHPFMITKMKIS